MPKDPIRKIGTKVKETKVKIMVTTMERVNMSEMGTTALTKPSSRVTMVIGLIGVVPMFHLKTERMILGLVDVVCKELRIFYKI